VNKTATVSAEYVAPSPAEDIEAYRLKVIEAFQLEPNGGSVGDFRLWAADAQGVARVYPYAKPDAPGEINLYVEATAADSTDGFGTPSAGLLSDVEDVVELDPDTTKSIDERGRRPILAIVNFLPVTIRNIAIIVISFDDLTGEKQAAILNAMNVRVAAIRPFIAGADALNAKNDVLHNNTIISEIMALYPGAIFGAVQMYVDGVLENSHTFVNGDIPNLVSITYV
jgi:hypothetical protein